MTPLLLAVVAAFSSPPCTPCPPCPPVEPLPPGTSRGVPVEVPKATTFRANAFIQGFSYSALGVEASHAFFDRIEVSGSANSIDLGRARDGMTADVLGRIGNFGDRHAFSLGIGPSLLLSPDFGPVAFLVPEGAYELRVSGFTFAAGLGLPIALNKSREVPCTPTGFFALDCIFVRTHFQPGDAELRIRVAAGIAF